MDRPIIRVEGVEAEEEVLLRRVNAGVAGRKKKKRAHAQRKQQQGGGLQRKNTIFGSRPRVERRLTSSSSTARGSSRMFYRSARHFALLGVSQNDPK